MIRKFIAIAAMGGILAATPSIAADSCRDSKGKPVPCKTVVTKKTTTKVTTAKVTNSVVKGKDGKCRYASGPKKGQFSPCP